ncbi:YcaO-like family protein [Streptomyces sp. NPDC006668]|uniref:YcaO-like family protein n=1 Tax=Streptomyces sp. NPDC006668 TaxID=3156903 RepID=UPI00340D12EB
MSNPSGSLVLADSFFETRIVPSGWCGERGFPLSQAWALGCQVLSELGLSATFFDLGGDPGAWQCRLAFPDGTTAPEMFGSGKGQRPAARVGALYEALEHYLTGPKSYQSNLVVWRSAHELASELHVDQAVALLAENPDAQVPCRQYVSLADGAQISAPLFLSAPWYVEESHRTARQEIGDCYDYRLASRFSLNNGCAIGASRAEAMVHAINEIIERDALSIFLARSFFNSGAPLAVFDRVSLPGDLAQMLSYAESLIDEEIHLFDITTDLGVPSVLAYGPPDDRGVVRYGCGTSLSYGHAAYRAIGELIQGHLALSPLQDYRPPTLDHMSSFPTLRRCAKLELESLSGRFHSVPFRDTDPPAEPDEHLSRLLDILTDHGYVPYVSPIREFSSGVSVVHILIPGMERFMVVLHGHVVTPGARCLAALET